jgi:hypothetical protein
MDPDQYASALVEALSAEPSVTAGGASSPTNALPQASDVSIPGNTSVSGKPASPAQPTTYKPPATPQQPRTPGGYEKGELEETAKRITDENVKALPEPDSRIGLGFNDTFFGRLQTDAVPFTGLNQDFVRKTGVNDVDHKNTLRYSRLVDALNNKRYIGPAKFGSSTLVRGGAYTTGETPAVGDIYKMDGIETAESRAQKRAEGYEAIERGREIGRREDVKDMPAALERLKQLAVLEQAGKLTDAEVAERKELFTSLLQNQYNLPYMLMQQEYATQLGMTPQQYASTIALQMARYASDVHLTAQEYATRLGMDSSRYNTMLGLTTSQYGTMLSEFLSRLLHINIPVEKVNWVMSHDVNNPANYLMNNAYGGVLGVAVPDMQTLAVVNKWLQAGINVDKPGGLEALLSVMQQLQKLLEEYGYTAAEKSAKAAR